MYLPLAVSKHAEIEAAVDQVARRLAPDVVRIRYEIAQDWSDDWAIFFRVVLTDDASRFERIRHMRNAVMSGLEAHLDFDTMGVFPYIDFRTVSEQERRQEPAWA